MMLCYLTPPPPSLRYGVRQVLPKYTIAIADSVKSSLR